MQTLAERLQSALDRNSSLSQADLARACGISSASVSNWFTGETKSLRGKNARAAAAYLNCSRDWLETGIGSPGWTDAQHTNGGAAAPAQAQDMSHPAPYSEVSRTARVPVIGKLEMGASKQFFMRLNDRREIGSVPSLPGGPDTFAVQVIGDHLFPAVRHGACLVVEPAAPLTAGEPIFIETVDGVFVVGDLIADRPESITIASLHEAARTTLAREQIAAASAITAVVMASKFTPKS